MPSAPQHGLKRGQHELQKKAPTQSVPAAPDSTVSTKIICHHISTREANCHWKILPAGKNQTGCSNLKPHISCLPRTSGGQKKERNYQEKLTSWLRKWFSVLYQVKVARIWHFSRISHLQMEDRGRAGGEVRVYLPLNSFLPTQKIKAEWNSAAVTLKQSHRSYVSLDVHWGDWDRGLTTNCSHQLITYLLEWKRGISVDVSGHIKLSSRNIK